MNITYEKRKNNYSNKIILDKSKSNILILGPADNYDERGVVINPATIYNAYDLYGNSELSRAYEQAINITQDVNVYTCNCRTYEDFLTVADRILHYNFNYFIPIGLKMEDKFYDSVTKKDQYYMNYFLSLIEQYESITTVIATNNNSKDYDNMDKYITYVNNVISEYYKSSLLDKNTNVLLERNASDLIFVMNNLQEVEYANVILGAQLANKVYNSYPEEIEYDTVYDLDKRDVNNINIAYHKINYLTNKTSIENLVNMRISFDIYKNALIDSVIKDTIREIDLEKYRGKLYNAYIKTQVESDAKKKLNTLVGSFFKSYELINIGFVKTEQTAGYIYIELSIVPFGFVDAISMVLEV